MAVFTQEEATFDQKQIKLASFESNEFTQTFADNEFTLLLQTSVPNVFYLHPPGVFIIALCLTLPKSAVEYQIRSIPGICLERK